MKGGSVPSLDGRVFAVADSGGGVATTDTTFRYAEQDGVITASYDGGTIRRGFLVGTRTGDSLDFRYAQLHTDARPPPATASPRLSCWTAGAYGSTKRGRGIRNPEVGGASLRSCRNTTGGRSVRASFVAPPELRLCRSDFHGATG